MRQENYQFIKGHCGWDSVTLLFGEDIPSGEEHRIAHTLLEPPCQGGVEIGFMYPGQGQDDMRLRIIDSTTRTWLPMCGGMSQVIGLAAYTTRMKERFGFSANSPSSLIKVRTDSGLVPIETFFQNDAVSRVKTHLPDYADFLYQEGVRPVMVRDIPAIKVGYFLVFTMKDLKKAYPNAEFGHRGPGSDWELLGEIQKDYLIQEAIEAPTLYSMLYDLDPEAGGDAKIYTRFYRGKGVPPPTPLEAQCGTGTVAVAVAMAERGELPFSGSKGEIVFEWGNKLTNDPYGVRKSVLEMKMEQGRVVWSAFSHNVVELIGVGDLHLPSFKSKLF